MKKHKSPIGTALMTAGVLLVLAAVGYLALNLYDENRAGSNAARVISQMAANTAAQETTPAAAATPEPPLYVQNPDMEMPEEMIDGQAYIGVLSIPGLELELPVISQWSYPRLKLAPCRYSGSIYKDDMIICGHNYENHFRRFTEVETGDTVIFTDMDGNVFRYEVALKEQIAGDDTERMLAGEWDLTLFTCAKGGEKRVTLRCMRTE